MGCFESYMEFREEVERIKINQKDHLHLPEKQKGAPLGDLPLWEKKVSESE